MATFADALADCLDAMRAGAGIEECLGRYPKRAKQLRQLLETAEKLAPLPPVTEQERPSPAQTAELIEALKAVSGHERTG